MRGAGHQHTAIDGDEKVVRVALFEGEGAVGNEEGEGEEEEDWDEEDEGEEGEDEEIPSSDTPGPPRLTSLLVDSWNLIDRLAHGTGS
jgi:hypothetical protein